jgi:HPt (histidine-containing phosphotransfer) domain-containing protein
MHMDKSSESVAVGQLPQGVLPVGDAAEPVIDPQAIERLRDLDPGGRQGVLQRVLRAYESSLARHLVDIGSAGDSADLDRLLRAAHTLKSSSAAVGAMAFSQRCADIEQLVRAVETMPDAAELEALMLEGQGVLAAVRAMLAA